MATHTLDFERPLLELERQIEELKRVAGEGAVDVAKELQPLEQKLAELRVQIYRSLTPMQRVQVARHPKRPYALDYLRSIFSDFVELHGDRLFRDDPAIVGGWARRDPVEGREPARARRRGAQHHGPGPAAARRHRRDRARTPGWRPRRPRRCGRDARRGAAPPPGPARQAADRQAPQTARGEVPFDGRTQREMS